MPLNIGGLDLDPPIIGYIIGSYGAASAIFQALYFSRMVHHFGERKVFIGAISTFVPIFLLLPLINVVALTFGKRSPVVWILIGFVMACISIMDMAYGENQAVTIFPPPIYLTYTAGAIFMFITSSAPNKRSLGATNGLSQMVVSMARAIGPAFSTSLFSFSVQHNILRGFGVYALFALLSIGVLFLASLLPSKLWDDSDKPIEVSSDS